MADIDLATILADGEYLRRAGDTLVGAVPTAGFTDVADFGITGDGGDEAADLQAAFDSGRPLIIPKGVKVCVGAQIRIPSGLELIIDGRIERIWDGAGSGKDGAMFLGGSIVAGEARVSDVHIHGTGTVGAPSLTAGSGQIFNGGFDDTVFEGITVDTFWGGQAFVIAGDRMRMHRVVIRNSTVESGTGGIRFVGGDDFVAVACHVECGDDCLQFVPAELSASPHTRRGAYIGCTGHSTGARFIAVGTPSGTSAANIEDCAFIGCSGKASKRGVVVVIGGTGTGSIRRLAIRDCTVDCTTDTQTVSRGALTITNEQTAGTAVLEDVVVDNVNILNPSTQAANCTRTNRLTITNSVFEASRTPFTSEIYLSDCPDLMYAHNTVKGSGTTNAVLLTTEAVSAGYCQRAIVDHNQILAVANAAYGVEVRNGSNIVIRRNRFRHAAGATAGAAVRFSAGVVAPRVESNTFAEITATTLLSFANGCQGYVYDNAGIPPVAQIATAYTIKPEDDRRVVELNSVGARTFTLLLDSKTGLPVGEWVDLHNLGAGILTIAGEAGVTIVGPLTATTGQALRVVKTAANTYFAKKSV